MNKKTVLCLSGWAQKPDSLNLLFDQNQFNLFNFDYSNFANITDFFKGIKEAKLKPEIIIGWSLGGQLACRLIARQFFFPQKLILIAAPFEFVKSARIPAAMPKRSFDEFYANFKNNPNKTLKTFAVLMNIRDKNAAYLADNLDVNEKNHSNLVSWLEELERFSCFDLNFDSFPRTLIFHGTNDLVVHSSQAEFFKNKIKDSELELINNCGHTPHINFIQELQERIAGFIKI